MPQRTTQFQRLVTALHACLADGAKITESAMLLDMDTGQNREVDVLISTNKAGYELLIGVEVIEWCRPADVTWVEKMIQKHNRLPTNKLVLISKSGFSSTAIDKAAAHGVETITLDEATEVDWPLAVRLVGEGFFLLFDLNWKCLLHLEGSSDWVEPPGNALVHLPTQSQPTTVALMAKALLNLTETKDTIMNRVEETMEKDFHMIYTQNGAQYEAQDGSRVNIVKLCIALTVQFSRTPVDFAAKKFKGNSLAVGQSSDPRQNLCFALKKNGTNGLAGVLYDGAGFKSLTVD